MEIPAELCVLHKISGIHCRYHLRENNSSVDESEVNLLFEQTHTISARQNAFHVVQQQRSCVQRPGGSSSNTTANSTPACAHCACNSAISSEQASCSSVNDCRPKQDANGDALQMRCGRFQTGQDISDDFKKLGQLVSDTLQKLHWRHSARTVLGKRLVTFLALSALKLRSMVMDTPTDHSLGKSFRNPQKSSLVISSTLSSIEDSHNVNM